MSEGTILTPVTDRSLFSMHPEDWVTQQTSHDIQCAYLREALASLLPDCFVAHDLAVYWVPGRFRHPYVGPDIFVARRQPLVEDPKAWLVFEDGPLDLVIEVASDTTRDQEEAKRDEKYAAELEVPEYVYIDLHREELRLERLVRGRYEPVAPDDQGRLWSAEFGVGFVRLPGERLVRVTDKDGMIAPTGREREALQREAEARAGQERQQAQQQRQRAERAERQAARERQRAQREAEQRRAAERRAHEEAEQRRVAEQRIAALAAELDRLRQSRERDDDPPPTER
jgi:Uma2 family endonuclease